MKATGISTVLGLERPGVAALAGSGGKTTLLYALAAELAQKSPVVVTTTTHILPPEAGQVAQLWRLRGADLDQGELDRRLAEGSPLAVVERGLPDGKLAGLNDRQVESLKGGGRWVLVEADGSARLPLKAWAGHEPAVPACADEVLLLVGASGLGRPLNSAWVHRPELFAKGSGLTSGQTVSPASLARLLFSQEGPLGRLPAGASRQLIINQIDAAPAGLLRKLAGEVERENQAAGQHGFKRVWWARLRAGWIGDL